MRVRSRVLLVAAVFSIPTALCAQGESTTAEQKPNAAKLEIARAHRDAVAASSRLEAKRKDLEVRVIFFPDTLRWQLLTNWIDAVEQEESAEVIASRLAEVRKKWKKAAGRPGFEISLSHTVALPETRSEPRTMHLFPGDPEKMIVARFGRKTVDWDPLQPPEGIRQGRIRVAKHHTTRERRNVPFVRELEPRGARWVLEGKEGSMLGVMAKALARKKSGVLRLQLHGFDRFRGPSPEPNLLDLNDTGSQFERELELELRRSWPPPWPPLPAALESLLEKEDAQVGS